MIFLIKESMLYHCIIILTYVHIKYVIYKNNMNHNQLMDWKKKKNLQN